MADEKQTVSVSLRRMTQAELDTFLETKERAEKIQNLIESTVDNLRGKSDKLKDFTKVFGTENFDDWPAA